MCPFCGQAFYQIDSFEAHVNRHQNSRPWKCDQCYRDYLTQRQLKIHIETHNPAHQCDKCQSKYGSLNELKRHIRKVHDRIKLTCRHACGYKTWGNGNRNRHEADCKLNPLPGAPHSISNGTASQFVLDNYQSSLAAQ